MPGTLSQQNVVQDTPQLSGMDAVARWTSMCTDVPGACQKLVPPPFDQLNSFPISMPPQILILSGLLSHMENSKPNIFLSSKFMSSYSRVKSKWINLKQVIFVWSKIIILVVHAKCHFTFHTIYLCARAKRITICMIVDCRRCNKKRYPIKRSNEKRLPVQRCFIRPPFEKDPIKGSFFLCRRNFPSALKVYGDNKKRTLAMPFIPIGLQLDSALPRRDNAFILQCMKWNHCLVGYFAYISCNI